MAEVDLADVALFAQLPRDALDELTARVRRRRYRRGELIFVQGDPSRGLYIVSEGRVKLSLTSPEGREVILDLLGPGEVFGELALLDGEPRSTDAVAVEPSELLLLDRDEFLTYVRQRPELAIDLLSILARRLRRETQVLQDAAFVDVPARLARTILQVAEAPSPSGQLLTPRLTQSDLAGMVGTTREALNKWLGFYENQGLIARQHGRITVLQPERLRRRTFDLPQDTGAHRLAEGKRVAQEPIEPEVPVGPKEEGGLSDDSVPDEASLSPAGADTHLQVQFAAEPLTAQHLARLTTALTDLHTRCWLIHTGRLEDLARYAMTRDPDLIREANLVVASIRLRSPLDVKLDISPQGLAEAMKTGIESVALLGARRQQAELENRGRELELEIRASEAEQAAAQHEQELELQRREREVAQQEKAVEIERKRLELERTRLELVRQQLELRVQAIKAANEMLPLLYPGVSDDARPMLIQTLVPSLLQLSELSVTAELTASTSPTRPALPDAGADQGTGGETSS